METAIVTGYIAMMLSIMFIINNLLLSETLPSVS